VIARRAGSGTIPINIVYSTEKKGWLTAALDQFNQNNHNLLNNKTIEVTLIGLGSVDSQTQILSGQTRPVAWTPASSQEMNRLNDAWTQKYNTPIIGSTSDNEPQSLVQSPLVLMAWPERAQKLLTHYRAHTLDWTTLHAAFQANSWTSLGGQANWGRVQFGQTVPGKSNSGLVTATLLAYQYFADPRNLTAGQFAASSKYWGYLDVFELAVNKFGCSSGTYLSELIAGGPALADVIATYENLALTNQPADPSKGLPIYYPQPNIYSNHPFAVLQGNWVTAEQSQAALQFRNFLMSPAMQEIAVTGYGFRPNPANQNIALTGNGGIFDKYASLLPNRQPDPVAVQAKVPGDEVINALIDGWNNRYQGNYTTLDC
jgi:hypothetical protein